MVVSVCLSEAIYLVGVIRTTNELFGRAFGIQIGVSKFATAGLGGAAIVFVIGSTAGDDIAVGAAIKRAGVPFRTRCIICGIGALFARFVSLGAASHTVGIGVCNSKFAIFRQYIA